MAKVFKWSILVRRLLDHSFLLRSVFALECYEPNVESSWLAEMKSVGNKKLSIFIVEFDVYLEWKIK